jgi:hypothetical protein
VDSVFEAVKKAAILDRRKNGIGIASCTKSSIDYNSIVTNSIIKFCKTNSKLKGSFNEGMAKTISKQIFASHLKSAGADSIAGLSSKQKVLIDKMSEVVHGKYNQDQLYILKKKLNEINQTAAQTLTEKEAAPIYCATSTAYASYQYWMTNAKKWYVALHYRQILRAYYAVYPKTKKANKLKSTQDDLPTIYGDDVVIYADVNFFTQVMDCFCALGEAFEQFESWVGENAGTIVEHDGIGAIGGVAWGYATGVTEGSVLFGPGGTIVAIAGEAVTGAVAGSVISIYDCLYE